MAFWADMSFPAFLERFCSVAMLGEITILAECISKVNVHVILWIPWCMHLSSSCDKVELLCPVITSLTKLCSLFISISGNCQEHVCFAVTSSFPFMLKDLIQNIETFNWTINVLVHILILHYLIYLNKGSWAGFQSHHTSSNPSLFYFHFNKADFIPLQLVDSWICPPCPSLHWVVLCRCLFTQGRLCCLNLLTLVEPWLWQHLLFGMQMFGTRCFVAPPTWTGRAQGGTVSAVRQHHFFWIHPWLCIFCVLLHLWLKQVGQQWWVCGGL